MSQGHPSRWWYVGAWERGVEWPCRWLRHGAGESEHRGQLSSWQASDRRPGATGAGGVAGAAGVESWMDLVFEALSQVWREAQLDWEVASSLNIHPLSSLLALFPDCEALRLAAPTLPWGFSLAVTSFKMASQAPGWVGSLSCVAPSTSFSLLFVDHSAF